MSTGELVASLVAAILVVQLVVSCSVVLWFRRRRRTITIRLGSELADEVTMRPPEPGSYRGSTVADLPRASNDGVIALTRRRLVLRTLTGKAIEIPVADIVDVREADAFKGVGSRRQLLVIQTPRGDVALLVRDNAAWIASLAGVTDRPLTGEGSTGAPEISQFSIPGLIPRRRGSMAVLAVVFGTIGVAFGVAAGISTVVTAESISGDLRAHGTVVGLSDEGGAYAPVVEFSPPGHPPVRFTSSLGSNPPAFGVGERVKVRYDPEDPLDAGIDAYWQTWFTPTLLGLFCATFLPFGIAFGAAVLAARRRRSV